MVSGFPVKVVRHETLTLNNCHIGLPLQISHGRGNVINQPDAPTCTFPWYDSVDPPQLGDRIDVFELVRFDSARWADPVATWADPGFLWGGGAETEVPRFAGYVDSLTAREEGGPVVAWDVGCVGFQAGLGDIPLATSRPAEDDVTRVVAVGAAAGQTIHTVGAAGVTLAAQVYDTDVLSALQEVCVSTGGLLWQNRAGEFMYGTAAHRTTLDPVSFDCEIVADGLNWGQDTGQIINDITAKWAGGEATFSDEGSVGMQWGVRHADVTTTVLAEADAEQMALLILRRRAWPYWGSPAVVVYADDLDKAGIQATSTLEVSSGILLPLPIGEPGPVPAPPSLGVVEGWVETWDTDGHTIQYAVSDSARWTDTRLRSWAEVATETWGYWFGGAWVTQLIKEPGDPV